MLYRLYDDYVRRRSLIGKTGPHQQSVERDVGLQLTRNGIRLLATHEIDGEQDLTVCRNPVTLERVGEFLRRDVELDDFVCLLSMNGRRYSGGDQADDACAHDVLFVFIAN